MKEYINSLVNDLQKLLQIDSIESEKKPNMPFGEGIYNALNYTLNLGKSFGFKAVSYSNYIGEIVFEAENNDSNNDFAVLCHLDVVPCGDENKWKFPPFSATISDGNIYARGTVDDKGPLIASLYALKLLKDSNLKPKRTIKLILGCDEESGWGCIEHYNKVAKMPKEGFSPDADFPVIYAEKGILHSEFYFDIDNKVETLLGGVAANVVCDKAEAVYKIDYNLLEKCGGIVENNKLVFLGKTAHASTPELGDNAIIKLIKYLSSFNAIPQTVCDVFVNDSLKLKTIQDETGYLTFSPDIIKIKDGKLALTVDFRYPSTYDGEKLLATLKQVAPFEILEHQKPLFNDKNGKLVQTLLSVYNDFTGENAQPIAIGGGTYARALKNGAGFGPSFIGKGAKCHEPNEFISIKDLEFLTEIYKEALKRLCF